jgi:hypothetical protein
MEHVAIMKKSWGLTRKILSGGKRLESRWYKVRYPPWDRIKQGETVYFKDSGEHVSIRTEVDKVMQFSGLTPEKVMEILEKHGKNDGIEKERIPEYFELFKKKKYCILVFLKNPKRIRPFGIRKSGFGAMSSWICTEDVGRIRLK